MTANPPTLVVSNPPHGSVNLDVAAELLHLDVYATRLKSVFMAPEVIEASDDQRASRFASELRSVGFRIGVLRGSILAELPWPAPVTALTIDVSSIDMRVEDQSLRVPHDAEVLAVYCQPPGDRMMRPTVDIQRALQSGHGPTIAAAIQHRTILDLYFRDASEVRRATIVPDLLKQEGDRLLKDLRRRVAGRRVDDRLAGVRPRAPFVPNVPHPAGAERRRYSFGTQMLSDALGSIMPELRSITQYELASRLAFALSPMAEGEKAA